ncbi:hypothetical protein [Rhodohalobacter sp. 8-1]|uniref:hypothetical protein n=1 Tax=Rhodohalobacter sp. 8-1 TaxID=3131972 RepID=UPI0030EC3406
MSYLIIIVLILSTLALGVLQLPVSKNYLSGQIVNAFNDQYTGNVTLGSLQGFIPFRAQLNDVEFSIPDSSGTEMSEPDSPLSVDELFISLDLWQFIRGNINITELDLQSPDLFLKQDESGINIVKLFARSSPSENQGQARNFINNFSIFAPQISITNGRVDVDRSINSSTTLSLPDPLQLTNLNASFFVESLESQQFVEITSFDANTNVNDFNELSLNAQLFANGVSLELNGFDFRSESATLQLSAKASPVNLFEQNVEEQLLNASYLLNIDRVNVSADILNRFQNTGLQLTNSLEFSGDINGNLDSLFVDNFQLINGESYLITDGVITNLIDDELTYDFSISNLVLNPNDLQPFLKQIQPNTNQIELYGFSTIQGGVTGSYNSLQAQLQLDTDIGNATVDSDIEFFGNQTFSLNAALDSLDISPLLRDSSGTSMLNGRFTASGQGFDRTATVETSLQLTDSKIKAHNIQALNADLSYLNTSGDYSLSIVSNQTEGSATGSYSIGNTTQFSIEAVAEQLDFTDYFPNLPYDNATFNGRLSANGEGTDLNDLAGRLSIEINESVINSDTLRSHQFYADINNPEPDQPRELRMTSSFLNMNASGTLYPNQLAGAARHWYDYLAGRINEELFFDRQLNEITLPDLFTNSTFENTADISIEISSRDLGLLKIYFPDIPSLESSAEMNLNINASRNRLSINGSFFDDSLTVNNSRFSDVGMTLTSNFQYGGKLKNNSVIDLQINSPDMTLNGQYDVSGTSVNMSLRDTLITVRQQVDSALENLFYYAETTSIWGDETFSTTMDSLAVGSNQYAWYSNGSPGIIYRRDGALTFNEFILESNEDYFEVDGTFSQSYEDSVVYNIRNFNLGRVSDLIGGRIEFGGVVDGEFTTRTLTQVPSILGDLSVVNGRINDRLVGDVTLRSRFNAEENRFDTELRLYTDPEKYGDYLDGNNGIGNDLYFEGYFKTPDQENESGDGNLVYFDADLREIDMWIVTFIVPNIISEMEGSGRGTGYFVVDSTGYDFEANFDVDEVDGVPAFTNVPYTLGGELTFNRADGLIFENIQIDDGRGGSGLFYGQVDLDDFGPMNYLDLRMELNDLRFMNNIQDPNVPFYADLTGSGTAVLDGTSQSPSLRSLTPIILSSNSNISIPLLEETELQQDRRFVQFVDSFDEQRPVQLGSIQNGSASDDEEGEVDLSFVELFSMNLQFIANDPVQVELIFDPVTNDILTARGTGQIRLILDDQDLSMFGRFNISSGDYQFVAGDIFTRRFSIQDGGTISWQGDLTEANLDVTASYRARPDISTLIPTGASFQRIPIELILQIGGTISQIENEFFFQLPSGIEGTQDPTIAAQINRLNQNEEEKVLQAFGILLTGNFVPSDDLQNPEFGNVTGTNTLVNPLVSSQIISPLLSNQINALLRSDVTLDVDFNLNAFNEVDLGVALRLFNDRIVLRREGQITGESEIGDLGATYRINQIFSITAFHRQDVTLSNRAETESRQTQEMNGMGVEAQFQFNTWQNLKNRIFSSIRKLFGLKEDEPAVDEDSDSLAEN